MKRSNSERAGWMQSALRFKVRGMRLFRCGEVADVHHLPINTDGSTPLAAVAIDAHQSACTPAFVPVMDVALASNDTKIADPVVVANAVDVVKLAIGPDPINVKPSKAMQGQSFVIYLYAKVSGSVFRPYIASSFYTSRWANSPSENSGIGIVVKKLAQTFCGKIGISHFVAPVKQWIGQMPNSVRSGFGHRHFIMGGC